MKNKDRQPVPAATFEQLPRRHGPAADLQRDVRGGSADRRRLPARLSARAARDPGPGRFDRRNDDDRRAGGPAPCADGRQDHLPASHRPHRLQGRRARGRAEGGAAASTSPFSTPTSFRRRTSCAAPMHFFTDPKVAMVQARWGHINEDYSLLTKIQAILLDGHFVLEHGGRNRAGTLLQFQRHRRHLAAHGDRRRRRMAARHADRGSRSELPRAASRLEVRVPARSRGAGRSAGGDERVQVAAAPVGERIDPDLPQGAARGSCARICRSA